MTNGIYLSIMSQLERDTSWYFQIFLIRYFFISAER